MLRWVGASIVGLQDRELKAGWDWFVLNLGDKQGLAFCGLSDLFLGLDECLSRSILALVRQRLCQLGNVGDDGLDHPCQRLDLLGETEECLGRNDKRLEVRYWRSESRVVKQSPVAIWCRRHRARLLRGKTRSLSGCLRGWWKDVGESVGVLRVWVTCWAFLRHRPSFQRQNIVEPFGVELRCRPDLVSAEYANLPTSIMIRISDFGWNRLSVVSALASVDLSVHSFCSTLES
ncbi:hypothetical protein BHM03_00053799 [Ensete ventricosum]|nr:hypothetical protein BHM03_00053799 [Ensete ventricosum]